MLEIPSNIYSHTKHLWDDIQSKLQANTDDITPFAMLPVRLETRFMKVKRKYSPYVNVATTMDVWDKISYAMDKFDTTAGHIFSDASKEINAYKPVFKLLTAAKALATEDKALYLEQGKTAINETADFLKSSIARKVAAANGNERLSSEQKEELITNLEALDRDCDSFKTIVFGKAEMEFGMDTSDLQSLFVSKKKNVDKIIAIYSSGKEVVLEPDKSIAFIRDSFTEITERLAGFSKLAARTGDAHLANLTTVLTDLGKIEEESNSLKSISDGGKKELAILLNVYVEQYNNFLSINGKLEIKREALLDEVSTTKTGISKKIGVLNEKFETVETSGVSSSEVIKHIRSIEADAKMISDETDKLSKISSEDKTILTDLGNAYSTSIDKFLLVSGKVVALGSRQKMSYDASRGKINSYKVNYITAIDKATVAETFTPPSDNLLSKWNIPEQKGVSVKPLVFSFYKTVSELWVRVFPDGIHIHTHENPLTQDEINAGLEYWNTWWNSGGDLEIRRGAWKALCELYGPERAAWIKEQLTPTNLPEEPIDDDSLGMCIMSAFETASALVKDTVDSDDFDPTISHQVNAYLDNANGLVEQSVRGKISGKNQEKILELSTQLDRDMENYNKMLSDADRSETTIDESRLNIFDYEKEFEELTRVMLSFRDPKAAFNSREWTNMLTESGDILGALSEQILGNSIALKSLRQANRVSSRLRGEIEINLEIIKALEKPDPRNELHALMSERLEGEIASATRTLQTLEGKFKGFKDATDQAIKTIKHSRIKVDEAVRQAVLSFAPVYGQIKQNVSNSTPVDPWNVFDHIPNGAEPTYSTPEIKGESWTEAPKTFVLPDRFVAVGLNETVDKSTTSEGYGENSYSFEQLEVGALIPAELHVGVDPTVEDDDVYTQTEDGNLIVDEEMEWMVDFNVAVQKGMGIIMELKNHFTPGQDANVFDKLVVMGVKVEKERFHKPIPDKDYSNVDLKEFSKELMEELLINHHYKEEGMGIVPVGTATNNTENSDSGWKYDQVHFEDSFAVENLNNLFPIRASHLDQRNGQRLAEALGVDYDIFQHIANADSNEISDGFKMNKMLWHGTMGNYLLEMLSGLVSRSNYERAKHYFESYVSARGIVPTLRVGNQPYGILPTSSFTKWSFGLDFDATEKKYKNHLRYNHLYSETGFVGRTYEDVNRHSNYALANKRFDDGFKKLLDLLQNRWYGLFHQPGLIKHVGGVSGTDDFMQALSLHASTEEIQLRFPYSIAELFPANTIVFPNWFIDGIGENFYGMGSLGTDWVNLVQSGLFPQNSMAFSQDNIVNHIKYLDSYFRVYKNTIDKYKLSETQLVDRTENNYIEWIRTADLRDIWDPEAAASNPFGTSKVRPLLFKLLRQSYLMLHLDAFVDVSIKSGLLDPNTYHYLSNGAETISNLVNVSGGNVSAIEERFSKWTYLLENISDFAGSTGAYAPLNGYKLAFDQYILDRNITGIDTTNFTFAQHVQNYYSKFWRLRGGAYNKHQIARMDQIYRDARGWSTAHLDRLFRENLDLGSYRLDAWMNGFVNRRLERIRKSYESDKIVHLYGGGRKREEGIYLGAYGWLENVKPGGARTVIDEGDHLPPSLQVNNTAIFKDDDNLGFVHGPSLYHAMTAAILRSGYASNVDVANNLENPMAVNLSSERARMGKNLWEGIKNGQSLGALLGYQMERNLHELYNDNPAFELDTYIYQFRKLYPIEEYIDNTAVNSTQAESIPAQNVINGINLLGDIREEMQTSGTTDTLFDYVKTHVGGSKSFSISVTDINVREALAREIDLMANAIDALGDLAVAEGVFQLTKGNFDRASTTIDTLLENRNLPLPEVLETPRTGTTVSHRMCVNMDSGIDSITAAVINPWTLVPLTDRAEAAPHINQFLARYLPSPANVRCLVKYEDFDGTEVNEEVSLVDLGWQPIDFYAQLTRAVDNNQNEDLLGRIAAFARQNFTYNSGNIPLDVPLNILLNQRDSNWTTADYSFLELLPILENISKVLAEIRPVKLQDFELPELVSVDDAFGWDLSELDTRIQTAYSNLSLLADNTGTNYSDLIQDAAIYNVKGAYLTTNDPAELLEQWTKIKANLTQLKDSAFELLNYGSTITLLNHTDMKDDVKWKKYLEIARIIFGNEFVMLPTLDLNVNSIENRLSSYVSNNQVDLMSNVGPNGFDQNVLSQWFYGLSRMRSKLSSFETLSDFDTNGELVFSPLQFPYESDTTAGTHDFWYGWEFPASYESTGNKISVVLTDRNGFSTALSDKTLVGFVLDEWTETIPEKEETSGLAFHYDQPNSKPAQNILLAVTPDFTGNWDGNNLLFILLDTLKMSKIRLVEPEHLQTDELLGKYLPTTYSMIELPGNTILNQFDLVSEYMNNTAAE